MLKEHYQGLGHIAVYTADMDRSIAFMRGSAARCICGLPPARRSSRKSWPWWNSAAFWWS